VWRDQLDAPPRQLLLQRVVVVAFFGNHALRILTRPTRTVPVSYAHRRERRFHEPDFVGGRRVKEVPTRIPGPTTTTIHFVPLPYVNFTCQ
jgi:hypothetical protein